MTSIDLSAGRLAAVVDLEHGGRLASLTVDDVELLVGRDEAPEPIAWGAYPMVPYAGRIRHGRFSFEGSAVQLPQTNGAHAIHGYGFTSRWRQLDGRAIEVDLSSPWPYRGRVEQRFDIAATSLTIEMTVHAVDTQPVLIGWHPWFRRSTASGELEAVVDAEAMYELDHEAIPTGRLISPPPGPWDNCFTGLRGDPRLRWGALEVELSSTADHWVVYDEQPHAVCVEPQTGAPDEINRAPRIVAAGESFSATMTYRVLSE